MDESLAIDHPCARFTEDALIDYYSVNDAATCSAVTCSMRWTEDDAAELQLDRLIEQRHFWRIGIPIARQTIDGDLSRRRRSYTICSALAQVLTLPACR